MKKKKKSVDIVSGLPWLGNDNHLVCVQRKTDEAQLGTWGAGTRCENIKGKCTGVTVLVHFKCDAHLD